VFLRNPSAAALLSAFLGFFKARALSAIALAPGACGAPALGGLRSIVPGEDRSALRLKLVSASAGTSLCPSASTMAQP
jgi:hypothetical protein